MDNYTIEIHREKSKHSTVAINNEHEKLQICNFMGMGPLGR